MSEETIIKVEINNKIYPISCLQGEEERVRESAKLVSETIDSLSSQNINSASDNRLLVMASLILADKIKKDYENSSSMQKTKQNDSDVQSIVDWIEKSTLRLNKLASLIDES